MSSPVALPGFEVGDVIGAGGFAVVWSAHGADGVERALKVARAGDDLTRRRFVREREALLAVGPAHAPRVLDSGLLGDGRPYILLERLAGPSLQAWIAGHTAPPAVATWAPVAEAVLASLAAAHAAGIVHRDLKPENIFLDAAGGARIIDFGMARMPGGGDVTWSGVAAGTAAFLAPERLRGEAGDARVDVYAFGAILFQILTLRLPFEGDRAAVERGHQALRPPRPGRFAEVSLAVEEVVLDCLAKDPAERPADATVLRAELARRLAAPAGAARPTAPVRDAVTPPFGDESVVLLVAEGAGLAARVAGAVRARGGFIASQRAGRHVALFSGAESHDPTAVAREVATGLATAGARVALHVARLEVRRRGPGSVTVTGEDVERPERWLSPGEAGEVRVTEAFRAAERGAESGGFHGRDAELASARALLVSTLGGAGPSLCTVLGARGAGKTRFLNVLARMAGELGEVAWLKSPRDLRSMGPRTVFLDDADGALSELLDAVEVATLGGRALPLLVVVAARPGFVAARRGWGRRAERHEIVNLGPLADADAAALAAELLAPAEYPPADALRQLARWSAGIPGDLVALVRRLKCEGVVRPRGRGEGFYLAAAVLGSLPPAPAGEWLAARELETLPPELAGFARLLSVLATPFSRSEAVALLDGLERGGAVAPTIDPGIGLGELVAHGILARAGTKLTFASAILHESLAALISVEDRQRAHLAALDFWRGRHEPEAGQRIARHAAGAGRRAEAATATLELAEVARAEQRLVDAELRYGEALGWLADEDRAARVQALVGRGRARYRLDRSDEALADLAAAAQLAASLGDGAATADALLEEATVLDWMERFADSAARVEEARRLVPAAGDLADRLLLADGRSAWRRQDLAALARLEAAAQSTAIETRIVALVLLGPALVVAGRLDEAEAVFARVLSLCAATVDRVHEGAAFANRMFLWMARGDVGHATADLRRAIDLAREVGHSRSEQMATFNLAEILYFSARDEEALPLARRARWLQQRIVGDAVPEDALLLARIHAARGDRQAAAVELEWIETETQAAAWSPTNRALIVALQLLLRGGDWQPLLASLADLPREVQLEVHMWHAVSGDQASRQAARMLAEQLPLFRPRIDMLFG